MLQSPAWITCWILWLTALVGVFVACGRLKDSARDKNQMLQGTWKSEVTFASGDQMLYTTKIAPDGSYVCAIAMPGRTNGPATVTLEGTCRVEGGFLVDIITKDSQTNAAAVPRTNRYRIVRIDSRELVLDYERPPGVVTPTNQMVFLKQSEPAKVPAPLEKANEIKLTDVKFDGLSLTVVIAMLHDESVKRDAARKGVAISLGPDAQQLANAEISLELRNVTLAEALGRVADSVGLEMQATDTELLLVRKKAAVMDRKRIAPKH